MGLLAFAVDVCHSYIYGFTDVVACSYQYLEMFFLLLDNGIGCRVYIAVLIAKPFG